MNQARIWGARQIYEIYGHAPTIVITVITLIFMTIQLGIFQQNRQALNNNL